VILAAVILVFLLLCPLVFCGELFLDAWDSMSAKPDHGDQLHAVANEEEHESRQSRQEASLLPEARDIGNRPHVCRV
jgi:hypothetical protein